ncbi:MAG: hypothetical protein NTW62_01045 [Candidatus Nomurabacteria bacterium]|nr:hypothetical protein [Candidatus Nomurabacteria bacterium]
MIYDKKKIISLVALVIIIILGVSIYFLNSKFKNQTSNNTNQGLTEAQRTQILENLKSQSANMKPLSDADRAKILKSLSGTTTNKPLTDAERAQILNSLKQ